MASEGMYDLFSSTIANRRLKFAEITFVSIVLSWRTGAFCLMAFFIWLKIILQGKTNWGMCARALFSGGGARARSAGSSCQCGRSSLSRALWSLSNSLDEFPWNNVDVPSPNFLASLHSKSAIALTPYSCEIHQYVNFQWFQRNCFKICDQN